MSQDDHDWHPVIKLLYYFGFSLWIVFALSFYSAPLGMLGGVAQAVLSWLTPKYVTIFMNTFSLVGAYAVTRLLVSPRIKIKIAKAEAFGVGCVIWVALTTTALHSARCDIYVYCSDDAVVQSDCEVGWDRQGQYCR